jgi:lipoprotein-releasing system permease protein
VDSWIPFEWIAAIRFLREGRLQTLFIISGVAIGVGVIIFMSALLSGLQANLFYRLLSSQPHITLERPKQIVTALREALPGQQLLASVQKPAQRISSVDQWQKVMQQMRQRKEVIAVSPTVTGPAFVVKGASNQAISLTGIDVDQYIKIVPLPDKIVAGTHRVTNTDIIIGTQLAEDMGMQLGDKLRVATTAGANRTLTIVGIFDFGNRSANQRTTFVLLSTAQNLLNLSGGVTSIDMTIVEPYAAEAVAQSIASETGLNALSWIAANSQFFQGMNAQSFSSLMIRIFVGLSVAAGIASVLVVSVVQRKKEIGILRAMGGSRNQIMRVFLIQGAVVGLLGSFLGSAFGFLLLTAWRIAARNLDVTSMFEIVLNPKLFIYAALIATLTGLIAAVTPAIRAARLDPVVATRG